MGCRGRSILNDEYFMKNEQEENLNNNSDCGSVNQVSTNSIAEYLEVLKIEYERDLTKRQSWQNRAGMILTVLSAICVFVLDKVKIEDILKFASEALSFIILIKILAGSCVYIFFLLSLFFSIKTIGVASLASYNIDSIEDYDLGRPQIAGSINIIHGYKTIIQTNREISKKTVAHLKKAYIFMVISVISIAIYMNC